VHRTTLDAGDKVAKERELTSSRYVYFGFAAVAGIQAELAFRMHQSTRTYARVQRRNISPQGRASFVTSSVSAMSADAR
jgi:hypothetical protein